MTRRTVAWIFAVLAAVPAIAALLPATIPGVEALSALIPFVPLIAIVALATGRRTLPSLLSIGALGVAAAILFSEIAGGERRGTAATVESLVIVTHNVGRANTDPQRTVAMLDASDADVLLLQETDGTIAPYLDALRRRRPFGNPCRRRCSMMILSRFPLTRVRWRFRDDRGAFGPGLYTTTLQLPWGAQARLAAVHLSRESTATQRAARRDLLAAAAARIGDDSLVLAGDFNLTPWGAAMRRLDAGLQPMQRATHALFSYPARWSGRAFPLPLLPIDHLYAGPSWQIADVERLGRTGSDHYPIRVKLLWRRGRL